VVKGVPADTVIGGVPVGLFVGAQLCAVEGEPVGLLVLPPAYMERGVTEQDARDMQVEGILVGPNWVVLPQHEHDSLPALSAIRLAVGGKLVVAASPAPDLHWTPV
jgi:hypothetical protein